MTAGELRVLALQRPDGRYAMEINAGSHSWSLDPDRAGMYAACCVTRALAAAQEGTLFRMLLASGQTGPAISEVVRGLRTMRPDDDWKTEPARFVPGFSMQLGPFVYFEVGNTRLGILTPDQLTQHAVSVLRMAAGVTLSDGVYRWARRDLDEQEARGITAALVEFWPLEVPIPT